MKGIKKTCIALLALSCIAFSGLGFASCDMKSILEGMTAANSGQSSTAQEVEKEPTQIEKVYAQYVIYAEAKGQTPLSYEAWLATIKGEKGDQGEQGIQGEKGEDGADGADGIDGIDDEGCVAKSFPQFHDIFSQITP